ncbi:hypothetical protein [Streptomyces lydicus]|uniref:hypothetical protein n=1 Tax=Streptomyces lydicus TaxID=47763 RepID=UPI0010131B14|nr:hypothetical protein [Streptomyces lydicus]MCZ1011840.1 hypothetical protein [Streptomyces lydicus]
MGPTPAPPSEAVALLTGHTGEPTAIQLLSDRRGSRTWKIQGPKGTVTLKANNPDDEGARDKAAEMTQEDDHLLRLTAAGALSPDYRVSAGAWEGGRWLAVNWIDGAPLWRALALARSPEGNRAAVHPWLTGIARTWTERLACGPATDRRVPYRGALTHTTAPELATAILATPADTHIPVQPAADIWSLGASLFWCWTAHRPVPYDDTTDRLEKLAAIAKGTTTALRDVRPWKFPEFEDALTACLTPDPAARPTAKELTTAW